MGSYRRAAIPADEVGSEVLNERYPLEPAAVAAFRRDGHTVVRNLLAGAELERHRRAIVDAARRHNAETRPLAERDTYGKAFLQTTNLWRTDRVVAEFVRAPRFAQVAAELMGVDGVRLYHDQALFKESGGGATPWHQDQVYWPLDTPHTITLWMPLVDVPPEVGTMTFASGSHRLARAAELVISDDSEAYFEALVRQHGLRTCTHGALQAGDATFHAGWTLHRAPPNPSATVREVMTVIYFADGARLLEPTTLQQADFDAWFPGCKPGDRAESELTPLLYRRS